MPLKSSMATVKIVLTIVLSVGIVGLATYKVATNPSIIQSVKNKLTTTISPARDLRGIWKSSLSGKGMQLFGKYTTYGSVTEMYENGDIELIINDVKDNIATGTMRYTNLCSWAETKVTIAGAEKIINVPKTCIADTGRQEINIRVSSSALDFGTISVDGVTATMQGSFTTDIMSGSMTVTMPGGILKGSFNLSRQN